MSENDQSGKKHHDLDQVWTSIKDGQKVQVDTQNKVASLEATMGALAGDVRTLTGAVNSVLTRRPDKTNWIGVGMIIIASIGMVGTYMQAKIVPTETTVARHTELFLEQMEQTTQEADEDGYQRAQIEMQGALVADLKTRMHAVEQQSAHCEATVEGLERWLNAVDKLGSRKHVISAADPVRPK